MICAYTAVFFCSFFSAWLSQKLLRVRRHDQLLKGRSHSSLFFNLVIFMSPLHCSCTWRCRHFTAGEGCTIWTSLWSCAVLVSERSWVRISSTVTGLCRSLLINRPWRDRRLSWCTVWEEIDTLGFLVNFSQLLCIVKQNFRLLFYVHICERFRNFTQLSRN